MFYYRRNSVPTCSARKSVNTMITLKHRRAARVPCIRMSFRYIFRHPLPRQQSGLRRVPYDAVVIHTCYRHFLPLILL